MSLHMGAGGPPYGTNPPSANPNYKPEHPSHLLEHAHHRNHLLRPGPFQVTPHYGNDQPVCAFAAVLLRLINLCISAGPFDPVLCAEQFTAFWNRTSDVVIPSLAVPRVSADRCVSCGSPRCTLSTSVDTPVKAAPPTAAMN